jgi:nickel-dependent lactate racemase
MTEIELGYGSTSINHSFDESRFTLLDRHLQGKQALSDAEVGSLLDSPIDSRPIDEIVDAGDSVLIVVSDATRATASAQIVNLVVRRLIQVGVRAGDISIIFATGIHRRVSETEKSALLTPFITQRLNVLDHDPVDPSGLMGFGTTPRGTPVELNAALKGFSHVILTGGIGFHYFAGFTGGRKSVCPGLASTKTIEATHMLALDFESGGRRAGVGTGLLEGNAVHEECDHIGEIIAPSFSINTVVNEAQFAVKLYCGNWRTAHRIGCEEYLADHSIEIDEKRDTVLVSCGGFPHDINMIQAHKSLDMAANACRESGAIVLLAECRDGLGRSDFLKWFEEPDAGALGDRLRESYEVNGQTAWSLLSKAEKYQIYLVSELPNDMVRKMRMTPARSLDEALAQLNLEGSGYIMPRGAGILPRVHSRLA